MRFFVFFILFISVCKLTAQVKNQRPPFKDDFQRKHILKTNLLSPILGVINFHFEWSNSQNSSSQVEAFYFTGQFIGQSVPYKGYGLTYNYRYYLTGTFPSGFFVQPYVRFQQFFENQQVSSSTSISPTYDFNVYGGGLLLGYQFIFAKRVTFECFGGPMYNISYENGVRTNSQTYPPIFTGSFVRIGSSLGFTF